jgi:DNA repair protein RecO (recombination protein O)
MPLVLEGDALFAGFYLNELLVRLLVTEEPQLELFALYTASLPCCNQRTLLEPTLRQFERGLLATLGYAVNFYQDAVGQAILPERYYHYDPEQGFIVTPSQLAETWQGSILLAIAKEDFNQQATRQAAKLILRRALAQQLGSKPLKSRELWQRTP